jgi:uncharacterized protein DUF3618
VPTPETIQAEIEATRAELARTVDLIAERLSPRRAAGRGVSKVKGVLSHGHSNGHLPASESTFDVHETDTIRSIPLPQTEPPRHLRKDRVALAVGATLAVVGLVVLLKRRK